KDIGDMDIGDMDSCSDFELVSDDEISVGSQFDYPDDSMLEDSDNLEDDDDDDDGSHPSSYNAATAIPDLALPNIGTSTTAHEATRPIAFSSNTFQPATTPTTASTTTTATTTAITTTATTPKNATTPTATTLPLTESSPIESIPVHSTAASNHGATMDMNNLPSSPLSPPDVPNIAKEVLRHRQFKIYDDYSPLFMVLPTSPHALTSPYRGGLEYIPEHSRFQLLLLCECGDHTRTPHSNMPHFVHLHEHEPYSIYQPEYFFAEYGRYILSIMYLLRDGYSDGGLTIPSMQSRQLIDGIMDLSVHFQFDSELFASLVEDMIRYLENFEQSETARVAHIQTSQLQPRPTWRQLLPFLQEPSNKLDKDVFQQPEPPKNICRIMTADLDKCVKWVCTEHAYDFQGKSKDTSAATDYLSLLDIPRRNYSEEMNYLNCRLETRTAADLVLDIVIEARMLELRIKPEWDMTKEDLAALQQKLAMSQVTHLTFDGAYLSKLRWEHGFDGRSYDPILQTLADGRIQAFSFLNCLDFFKATTSRLGRDKWVSFELEALHLTWTEEEDWGLDEFMSNLVVFVEQYPRLEKLSFTIHCNNFAKMAPLVQTLAEMLQSTDTPTTVCLVGLGQRRLECILREGSLHDVEMTIQYSQLPVSKTAPMRFGSQGIQKLNILTTKNDMSNEITTDSCSSYFAEFLQACPNLSALTIRDEDQSQRVFRVAQALNYALRNHGCSVLVHYLQYGFAETVFTIQQQQQQQQQGEKAGAVVASAPKDKEKGTGAQSELEIHFLLWKIPQYDMRVISDAKSLGLLDRASQAYPHNLQSLVISTLKLDANAVAVLEQIVDRSVSLSELTIMAPRPTERSPLYLVAIPDYSMNSLTSLTFDGVETSRWMCHLKRTAVSRTHLPNLAKLRVRIGDCVACDDGVTLVELKAAALDWLCAIVAKPPCLEETSKNNNSDNNSGRWTTDPLKVVSFNSGGLQHEQWKQFIGSLNLAEGGLEVLDVQGSNFDGAHIRQIKERRSEMIKSSLKTVYCYGTYALRGACLEGSDFDLPTDRNPTTVLFTRTRASSPTA
ncbi:hypothetical protein BG004_002672, partial [Podila humilis]